MQFTDDEIETIKALIEDHGFEYSLQADADKVWALGVKLGILNPVVAPTEEELKRNKEFINGEIGSEIIKLMNKSNVYLKELDQQYKDAVLFGTGVQWDNKIISLYGFLNVKKEE